jgi:hypothetical protein
MRLLPASLALIALTTAALPYSVEPLPQLTLRGGTGVMVAETGVNLLLTAVTDQRCPPNVDCYWEGMIRAEITVQGPKPDLQHIVLCNLCDDGDRSATVAGLTFNLMSFAPSTEELAHLGRAPLLSDYALTVAYKPARS